MLQLQDVTKSFEGKVVLHPTSLSVQPGETTVLIGPSGCGKSTLLRAIVGLVTPDSGCITLNGQQLDARTLPALRPQIGYVIQDGGLFPHLSARQNVGLMAQQLGWDADQRNKRINELACLVRLPSDLLDRYPAQLSGGQKQRVGIMRALMLDPALLLLDEPMAALDPLVRAELQEDLKNIFQRLQKMVLMVTHDMGEAGFFGQRVLLLGEGRVVQTGCIEDLIRRPASDFVTQFIRAQRLPLLPEFAS
jgi:osmoprotectant transport system ATP-binding protein